MTSGNWVLPERFIEHARSWAAQPGRQAAPARRAATVMLLRPGGMPGSANAGPDNPGPDSAAPDSASPDNPGPDNPGPDNPSPEVYLLRRAASMAFASGMYVFPGGTVDPRDATTGLGWAGPDAAHWADRLGLADPAVAQAVVCAAVRETFEECGVLLAGPDAQTVLTDVRGEQWQAARRALVSREIGFAEFLAERGLLLRSDLLRPWARWITPEFEPRRFDTYFFLAALPAEQETGWVCGEADDEAWLPPAEALRRYAAGEIGLLPPTEVALRELAPHPAVADALAAAAGRDAGTPVLPRIKFAADGSARLVA